MKTGLHINTFLSIFFFFTSMDIAFSQCSELIFNDEFTGNSVDLAKWSFDNGDGCPNLCGWGNAEEQWYQPENTTVQDGKLIITTKNETFGGKQYTSSKLITSGKFNSKFGRYEASIKLPSAGGIWPAFWMLPENGNWPFTGEIDIMESQHRNPESIGGTVHYSNGGWQFNGRELDTGMDLSEDFHQYAVEWEPTEIRWYFDNQLYHTVTPANTVDPWPFSENNFYLILNVAVGGVGTPYTGNIPPTPADYPTQMEVDYVRVYNGTFNRQLSGDTKVYEGENNKLYSITPVSGATYSWSVPQGTSITSGQGTNTILVTWGTNSGNVSVTVNDPTCGNTTYNLGVSVSPPRTLDFIFEDFENNRKITYGSLTSGTLTAAVTNPGPTTTNNSGLVGRYERNGGSQYDGLFMESSDIGNALEYVSGKKSVWMEIYSDAPVGTELILQLEDSSLSTSNYPQGRHSRYTARTTVQNQWETLEFELLDTPDTSVGALNVDQFVLLLAPNSYTTHTLYFDTIRSMAEAETEIVDETIIANYDGINRITPFFQDGTYTAAIANPSPGGLNSSANVARYTRNATAQYDVVSFSTDVITDSALFKEEKHVFFMDVYTAAPVGTEITISLENENISMGNYPSGRNSQYKGVISEQNSWHTIEFNHVSSPDANTSDTEIDEISVLFNPNSNTSDTYYFDNFRYGIKGVVTEDYCSGTADNEQYSYIISKETTNPSITFVPETSGIGDSVCILYYETNRAKIFAGYNVTPNVPFQIEAKEGEIVYFYYTYSLPQGGENTTLNSQHGFMVGSCNTNVLGNKNPKITKDVTVFPNPFEETITLSSLHGGDIIQIFTLQGKQIGNYRVNSNETRKQIELDTVQRGFYFVKVIGVSGNEIFIEKLLKK